MATNFYGKRWALEVTKSGEVRIRDTQKPNTGRRGRKRAEVDVALPVYTVDTKDEAEMIQVRMCVLSRVDNETYFLNPQYRAHGALELCDLPLLGAEMDRVHKQQEKAVQS